MISPFYRLLNETEQPRVGDEVYIETIPVSVWSSIDDENDLEQAIYQRGKRTVIRRLINPEEVAMELSEAMEKGLGMDGKQMEKWLLPHIQAALEGKA